MSNLIEILKENDVKVSSKGNIYLEDFVEKIIESKNPDTYIKKIENKFNYRDEYCITEETCLEILNKSNFKRCKDILEKIESDSESSESEEDNESIISIEENLFQYDGTQFTSFFIENQGEWDIWVKAKEVADFLEYKKTRNAIKRHVEYENKISYEKLLKLLGAPRKDLPKNLDKQTIFINMSGFFNLIHGSKQKIAKEIKRWIDNEVLPTLMRYGTYSMQPAKIKIEPIYDNVAISSYYLKAVMYMGYIGKIKGEHIIKYGLSRHMFKRDFEQHSKNFDNFQLIFIEECDNCEHIEKLFENDLKAYGLHRVKEINGKNYKELFTISAKHTYESLIEHMHNLIENNPLQSIKEAKTKLIVAENENYKKSEELRKLEMQFKLSENYKLELERDIIIKNIDKEVEIKRTEASLSIKKIEYDIEREKTKQLCIQNKTKFEPLSDSYVFKKAKNNKQNKKKNVIEL